MHAPPPPRATMHSPQEQPHTPPPEQPRMPPWSNHAHYLGATMHAPLEQPHTPPRSNHTCPPGSNHVHPPVNRMTNRCKNITLPQTSFAGGDKYITLSVIPLAMQLVKKSAAMSNLVVRTGATFRWRLNMSDKSLTLDALSFVSTG